MTGTTRAGLVGIVVSATAVVYGGSPAVFADPVAHGSLQAGTSAESAGSLTPGWSVEGSWTGLAAEEHSPLYALGRHGRVVEIDERGKIVSEVGLPRESSSLRLVHVGVPARLALLTFSVWGKESHAYAVDGARLWSYPDSGGNSGIDDVGTVRGVRGEQIIVGQRRDRAPCPRRSGPTRVEDDGRSELSGM